MTATTDLRTFAGAALESDELLSFCRDIFVNRLFAPLAGQADLRVGGLQGSDSVSTRHPPLKPLPDPIPLKIQFPIGHSAELLFTPAIDRDIHALFLKQIADSDPLALHVVIADQAGFHLPDHDARIPTNLRLLPLPPYSTELNPVERFGGLIKAAVANRLYPNLRRLEDHIAAASRRWTTPTAVSSLIHSWLADQVNTGVLT